MGGRVIYSMPILNCTTYISTLFRGHLDSGQLSVARQLQYAREDAFFTLLVARALLREAPGEAPHVLEALESYWHSINGAVAMEDMPVFKQSGSQKSSVWWLKYDLRFLLGLGRRFGLFLGANLLFFFGGDITHATCPVAILSGAVLSSRLQDPNVKHPSERLEKNDPFFAATN